MSGKCYKCGEELLGNPCPKCGYNQYNGPLTVVTQEGKNLEKTPTFPYTIKDSGARTEFSTGAVRDLRIGKGRFDLLPWGVIRAVAIHYELGCRKYGERNWEKGMPISKFFDSAVRHLGEFIEGMSGENHLIAAIWNLKCMYQTILWIQAGKLPSELYDLPNKVVLPNPYELIITKVSSQKKSK